MYLKEIKFKEFNLLIDNRYPLEIIQKCLDKCSMVQTNVTPQENTEGDQRQKNNPDR